MTNNLLKKPLIHFGALLIIMLAYSANNYANGYGHLVTNVLEEVRIVDISFEDKPLAAAHEISKGPTIPMPSDNFGNLVYELPDCSKCDSTILNYSQLTKLFNPFGAEKSIKELESWRGSRAQITYRMVDNHILEIKILP